MPPKEARRCSAPRAVTKPYYVLRVIPNERTGSPAPLRGGELGGFHLPAKPTHPTDKVDKRGEVWT